MDCFDIIRIFDRKTLKMNIVILKDLLETKKPGAELAAVIKVESYGFGNKYAIPVLLAEGVKTFFVQDMLEGMEVKFEVIDTAEVFVLSGVMDKQANDFIDAKIIPVCVNLEQLKYYNEASKKEKSKPKVAIHFDTGMNRTGLDGNEVTELSENFETITKNLDVVLYVSHLANSQSIKKAKKQLTRLNEILAKLPTRRVSFMASSGFENLSNDFIFDMVRIGSSIFGLGKNRNLCTTVLARILQVRDVKKGESIGYFGGWHAKRNMKVAVLTIGYKDGFPRSLSRTNGFKDKIRALLKSGGAFVKAHAFFKGSICPVVGLVSMNNIIVDITDVKNEQVIAGMFMEIIGKNVNPAMFREANGFIPCEMLVDLLRENKNTSNCYLDYDPNDPITIEDVREFIR